jgi:hypothetical protein
LSNIINLYHLSLHIISETFDQSAPLSCFARPRKHTEKAATITQKQQESKKPPKPSGNIL